MSFKKFLDGLIDILDDFLVYVFAVAGILFSNYFPALKGVEGFEIHLGWQRIVVAGIVAVLVIGKGEALEIDKNNVAESKARAKAGRRKRLWDRCGNALAQGALWTQFVQLA